MTHSRTSRFTLPIAVVVLFALPGMLAMPQVAYANPAPAPIGVQAKADLLPQGPAVGLSVEPGGFVDYFLRILTKVLGTDKIGLTLPPTGLPLPAAGLNLGATGKVETEVTLTSCPANAVCLWGWRPDTPVEIEVNPEPLACFHGGPFRSIVNHTRLHILLMDKDTCDVDQVKARLPVKPGDTKTDLTFGHPKRPYYFAWQAR